MLPRFVHTEYHLVVILKRCYIEETAQLQNFEVRAMNINTSNKKLKKCNKM